MFFPAQKKKKQNRKSGRSQLKTQINSKEETQFSNDRNSRGKMMNTGIMSANHEMINDQKGTALKMSDSMDKSERDDEIKKIINSL